MSWSCVCPVSCLAACRVAHCVLPLAFWVPSLSFDWVCCLFFFVSSVFFFFFSSRRRHTRLQGDWSSDVCSSDLVSFFAATIRLFFAVFLTGISFPSRANAHAQTRVPAHVRKSFALKLLPITRSEERRVGKVCRSRRSTEQYPKIPREQNADHSRN